MLKQSKTDMNLSHYLMWRMEIQTEIRMQEICRVSIRKVVWGWLPMSA